MEEIVVLREIVLGIARLSGGRIRNQFFFGTRPGTIHVAVSFNQGYDGHDGHDGHDSDNSLDRSV